MFLPTEQPTAPAGMSVTFVALLVLGCCCACALTTGSAVAGEYSVPRLIPRAIGTPSPPPLVSQRNIHHRPVTLRVRSVNVWLLPFRAWSARIPPAVFVGADVVLLQELFRKPSLLGPDAAVVSSSPRVSFAVPAVAVPIGKLTDSGLAIAGVGHVAVANLAFRAFAQSVLPDSLANKGVAVFQCSHGLRLATTHMQADYGTNGRSHAAIRLHQFKEAVEFAVEHGAAVLAADANTSNPSDLQDLDDVVVLATNGRGYRLHDDGMASTPVTGGTAVAWRRDPNAFGQRVDHVWALGQHVTCSAVVTQLDVTDPWSDHAALDFTVSFAVPLPSPGMGR